MLHLLSPALRVKPSFMDSAVDLLRSTTRLILCACIAFGLLLVIVLSATWPLRYGWNLLPTSALVVLPSLLALRLLGRHFVLSHIIWQAGSVLAIIVAAATFHCAELLFLLATLPMMAMIILGWQAGLIGEGLLALLIGCLARLPVQLASHEGYGAAIVLGGALGGGVGWAATRALIAIAEWSFYSYEQAERNLAQVREHRQQLARLVKSLDQAYHQLERVNGSLVAAWRTAHEAERLKAEFVANVSHELRTPLNLIIGYSEVIVTSPESYRDQKLPGAYRRDITAIYNGARHLQALVDDVLELGRIEAGKIALTRDWIEPAALVREVEELVRDYVAAKGLELRMEIEDGLPSLRLDRLRIRQVLLNLVVNAVRFTERGQIRIEVLKRDDDIAFSVADTGRGIDPRDLPHVFEPFHTTGLDSSGPWHSGAGLGLPISKRFVELHGGWVDVQSTLNQGTIFTVYLPCIPYAGQGCSPAMPQGAAPVAETEEGERIIVVAPNDPLVISQLEQHMEGYRFVGARNIDEGLAMAEELQATAVVANSAERPSHPSPLLVVSLPWPSSEHIAAGLGARDFLPKPVSRQQLFAAIDRLGQPVRRILIVDDDPELASLFQRMLRARLPVSDCLAAYSAEEALQRLNGDRPDLVLLGLSMPGKDGRYVIEQMAAHPEFSRLPVIVVSGMAWAEMQGHFAGPIQITKTGGFQLREVIKTLDGIFRATLR